MYGYIYMITNIKNNKKYIGKLKSKKIDYNYYSSSSFIEKEINKYGKENFKIEVLEKCFTEEDLNNLEKYYIFLSNALLDNNFYNFLSGGKHFGMKTLDKVSKEKADAFRETMSRATRGKNNGMYGKKHTEESIQKMKYNSYKRDGKLNPMYNKKHSDFSIQKMKNNQWDRNGDKNPLYGKTGDNCLNGRHHLLISKDGIILKYFNSKHALKEYFESKNIKITKDLNKKIKNKELFLKYYIISLSAKEKAEFNKIYK